MDVGAKPVPARRRFRLQAQVLADAGRLMLATARAYLRLDLPIAVFSTAFVLLFAPLIPRNTDNPQLLAAYANDEPFLTMALEATLVPPYGNPGRYFDPLDPASGQVPEHWGDLRYANITYYGGAMFDLAFPPYAALRALGVAPFPAGPIILRTLTLLAALLSLVVLYNIAKERGSRLVGLLAAAFVAADGYFLYYANFIHPDTLQMFFGLCAFLLAVRHARDGRSASLIALGLFCGIVQGTKSGGAWTIPMGLLAIWLGAKAHSAPGLGRRLGLGVLLLGTSALIGFFVSTPYAFVNSYYRRAMAIAYDVVRTTAIHPGETLSVFTWGEALYDYVGLVAALLVALTIWRALWTGWRRTPDAALILGVVLSISQFLWYGVSGKLWHVPGYLILAFGLMAVFAFESALVVARGLLARAARVLGRAGPTEGVAWVATVVVVVTVFASGRWYVPVSWAIDQYTVTKSTVRAANSWAIDHHVRPDAVIVHDDLAYFDRERFPRATMYGGVLTWRAVDGRDPDYIVLSSSLYGAAWMQNLIETQRLARRNPDPFNVSLYQDLLATSVPGPTRIPGIELEGILRPASASSQRSRIAGLADACAPCDLGVVDIRSELGLAAEVERRLRALDGAGREPLVGPELRIYHVDRSSMRR